MIKYREESGVSKANGSIKAGGHLKANGLIKANGFIKAGGNVEPKQNSFSDLKIDDTIYWIDEKNIVPKIIYLGVVCITKQSGYIKFFATHIDNREISFKVPIEKLKCQESGKFFTSKELCNKRFEEMCIHRIVEISKALGSIQE